MKSFMSSIYRFVIVCIAVIMVALGLVGCSVTKNFHENDEIETKIQQVRSEDNYVTIDNISEDFLEAIVAIEDHRYYDHGAVDVIALTRATVKNFLKKDIVEGGSTITQQLAKNLFLTGEQTIDRKVKEIFIAYDLEKNYTKDEILELYVNVIYFGDNHYGIKEASNGYFGKEPSELTFDEATLLAGLPQAPSTYALSTNYDKALKRQQEVIEAMK